MKFLCAVAVLSLWLITANARPPQQPQSPQPVPAVPSDARPAGCADRSAILDSITQSVPVVEPIIVISRRGDGETRANLGWRRLLNVRTYWTKFLPAGIRREPETIILGEGKKVGGFGRVEFYTGGKLFYAIKLRRNEDLLVGECYPPDDSYIRNGFFNLCEVKSNRIFYPCLDVHGRRGGRARRTGVRQAGDGIFKRR
jgi:hypothetical protein